MYHSRTRRFDVEEELGIEYVGFDTLFAVSDVVSIHCPLDESTRRLVGPAQLDSMRPDAILVNTARAWVVDPTALRDTLGNGCIGAAAFDVYYQEPAPPSAKDPFGLLAMYPERFLLTPHVGYLTPMSMTRMSADAVASIIRSDAR